MIIPFSFLHSSRSPSPLSAMSDGPCYSLSPSLPLFQSLHLLSPFPLSKLALLFPTYPVSISPLLPTILPIRLIASLRSYVSHFLFSPRLILLSHSRLSSLPLSFFPFSSSLLLHPGNEGLTRVTFSRSEQIQVRLRAAILSTPLRYMFVSPFSCQKCLCCMNKYVVEVFVSFTFFNK